MCRTQRHLPSGDITCNAEIGWLQRIVMVPMSSKVVLRSQCDIARLKTTVADAEIAKVKMQKDVKEEMERLRTQFTFKVTAICE